MIRLVILATLLGCAVDARAGLRRQATGRLVGCIHTRVSPLQIHDCYQRAFAWCLAHGEERHCAEDELWSRMDPADTTPWRSAGGSR